MIVLNGQVVKDFTRLALLVERRQPQGSGSRAAQSLHIARLRRIKFLRDEIVERIEIFFFQRRQGRQPFRQAPDGRTQVIPPKLAIQLAFVQDIGTQVFELVCCILHAVAQLDGILGLDNAVAHIHDPAHHRPRGAGRIEQRITCVKQVSLHPTVIHPHGILQYGLVEQHLHTIVFLGFYLTADGIFVGLARLHLDERRHVALHVVEAALQPQRFTNVRRLQHGILPVESIPRCRKGILHRPTDIVEMQAAVGKELPFLRRITQLRTSRQLQRIGAESLLHACQIIGLVLGMNPFVQEKVSNVTQQQRPRIVRWLKAGQDVIGGMMAILLETFGQRTDIDQVVGFENDERRSQYALLVDYHIQQIDLRMTPQQGTGLTELIVDIGHVVAHLEPLVRKGVKRLYIEKGFV